MNVVDKLYITFTKIYIIYIKSTYYYKTNKNTTLNNTNDKVNKIDTATFQLKPSYTVFF